MSAVPLRIALPGYHHTRELVSGVVALAGVEPTFVRPGTAGAAEADVVDMPLLDYLRLSATGAADLTAVPVFPARSFLHSWVHLGDAAATAADDTAASARGSEAEAGGAGRLGATAEVWGRSIAASAAASGELVIAPPASLRGVPGARPLFADPGAAEREAFAATGIYPILTVLAVRPAVLAENRWLATNLYRAFEVCRRRYFDRLADIRGSRVPIPSIAGHVVKLRGILGPDLCPYGVEPNRAALEAFAAAAVAQGAIDAPPVDVADLFAPVEPFVDFTDGI